MKPLKEKYKTYAGAQKRCRFENSLAKFEFERGHKLKHYRYTVFYPDANNHYRVIRHDPTKES